MTSEIIKRMFDACYQAKRTREMLPPLPEGVRSSFIQYLDTIQSLEGQGVQVKVSDISDAMELPRPGVTRTVKEMEEKGYLKKMASEADGFLAEYVFIWLCCNRSVSPAEYRLQSLCQNPIQA